MAIKTNDPTVEIHLLDADGKNLNQKLWQPDRQLANDLLSEIDKLIASKWKDLTGLIVFRGPGSFTGLRIGIATMNTLAYSLNIPIVGADGTDWLENGFRRLKNNQNDKIVIPEYGQPPNITKPTK